MFLFVIRHSSLVIPPRLLAVVAALAIASSVGIAQEESGGRPQRTIVAPTIPEPTTSIYGELGGNATTFSINLDGIVFRREGVIALARAGVGIYLPDTGSYPAQKSIIVPLVPLLAQALLFSGEHHLELGAGVLLQLRTLGSESYFPPMSHTAVKGTFVLGYRYRPTSPGIMFRAGLTPVWYNDGVYWGAGLSAGWCF